jgi:hypothetical protein
VQPSRSHSLQQGDWEGIPGICRREREGGAREAVDAGRRAPIAWFLSSSGFGSLQENHYIKDQHKAASNP